MAVKRKSWVQPADAAKYFEVTPSTVRQWISDGRLPAVKLPTGHLRILARDVVKRLLEQGRPVPTELSDLSHKHVLIVDPDHTAAESVAAALRSTSRCRVTVAETSAHVRGLLNGYQPDLVLLGVRHPAARIAGNGSLEMLVLANTPDGPPPQDPGEQSAAFQVNDILPSPVDEQTVVSRIANVLLG